jgi:uncharacterized protein YndB with AHSA1/START domain
MALVQRTMAAPREAVFAVLSNGWSYSDWVVGAVHVRAVDERWPQPGAVIHHETGPWPVSLHDRTVSLRCEPPSLLVVSPHLWPLGEAVVSIALEEAGPDRTVVAIEEEFHRGPLRWLRSTVNDLALHFRNRESLRRLEDLAIRRTEPADGDTVRAAMGRTNQE